MIIKQGKGWGITRKIYRGPMNELHHLSIKKGGYCSEHQHKKFNLFYVLSGLLEITIWRDKNLEDITKLGPEEVSAVSPGFWHKFRALEDTECMELYYVLLEDPDIERRTQGGMEK
ncbi:unnamed protein product [marine sediment metagenome]|uniref:Cupin 2 conserved barrel domain-containing protein n=1 Tax=marine sediment metagenome TaxID=412755 RepID=X1DIF2_9ZZZZ